jgi:hypothetical protein
MREYAVERARQLAADQVYLHPHPEELMLGNHV